MASKLEVLNELLEETLSCAEENECTADLSTFRSFVEDMLPPDILDVLYTRANASLEDIWMGRYYVPEPSADCVDGVNNDVDVELDDYYDDGCCVLCERDLKLTRHHTIPREMHERVMKKFGTPKEVLNQTIPVCRMCHSAIHRFFTNKELAFEYNTLEKIVEDERVQKYAKWACNLAVPGTLKKSRYRQI
eukprot:CAMPEP_0170407894 /NCGR_PEP_ID=MMETSP0117_2-20130122/28496_1 /TAXON_ID=400756 /ORGANISM="Durinskia baltica, Strain CSIRO CS-38" /LENGTH=190 /DNA_ID=CAMNT_0010665183 /DNA_START=47 /DNA_END=619 /DNA_ORIENTATION=+